MRLGHSLGKLRFCSSIALIVVTRCSSPPTAFSTTTAIVYGTVQDASGAAVANAHVALEAFLQSCGVGGAFDSMGSQTSSAGEFRMYITSIIAPQQICVRATTSLNAGSPPVTKDVSIQVRPASGPIDSARVDFVVNP
jgi:hypothetical protein